ncbi:2-polyprenyl-3-methyl-5-hydroxy-6-metoxy-1,4-benzoquinol methylase [Pedobacter sp. W3I1]|uniref:class I SAM-dependent methyltransferase n=1 Tax=Pedobacter sp. W3I1 TaxID=3042291 RepID=UPI00277FD60A|nr:class I SAM-dependent methyltransferase [Pedobacter sp. W3I1]MDQ0640918.1 2-polyprenyl-3-methyl-5-hydroxy-6-metoxy-1,4-benzoquinol methylase [Pedobacter sp. W3I1]
MKVSDKIYNNSGNLGIIRLIKKLPSKILDVGCGAGNNASLLKELGNTIDGITISNDEMKLAAKFCGNIYNFNLENGLPDEVYKNQYNYIICSHILEHIAFPEKLLVDIYNLASKNKATILIALPNIMYFKTRFNLLLGKFEYTHDGIMDYTHLRWYTKKSAAHMFEKYNFNVKSSSVNGLPPLYSILGKLGKKPLKIINQFLFFIAPTLFGSELLFELECN